MLSTVFYPIYVFTVKHIKWKTVAALITLLIILVVILGPFSYLSYLLISELKTIGNYLQAGNVEPLKNLFQHPTINVILNKLLSLFNLSEEELNKTIAGVISQQGNELVGGITKGMANIITISLDFIFMVFSIFFFLKDGPELLTKIRNYLPFSEKHKDRLVKQVRDIVISTIYGGIAVSIVQGTIAGVAFFILGIPNPVVWGFTTSIASFIPLLGASAVWVPITIYLFIEGAVLKGLALAIIGIFGISLIDNILKPIIIGSRTKMPILVIFFSILGGIKLFGLIGLIMGPLVLALFVSLIEIFRSVEGGQNA